MLDLPPVYLIFCLALAYRAGQLAPLDLGAAARGLGTGLSVLAVLLMLAAVFALVRARTTPIPREAPNALVTSGIFRLSRNPIYLGDALLLAGLSLRWDAAPALILVPAFVIFITRRFIAQEEQTLSDAFPDAYPGYLRTTRRWV